MKHIKNNLLGILVVTMLVLAGMSQKATAQDTKIEHPDIQLEVNGLACPFCAYGIEKRLLKIKTIEQLAINIKEGIIDLKLQEDAVLSAEKIRKTVSEAGFSVESITYRNKKAQPQTG